jgi:hypothetical protein
MLRICCDRPAVENSFGEFFCPTCGEDLTEWVICDSADVCNCTCDHNTYHPLKDTCDVSLCAEKKYYVKCKR